MDKNIKTNEYEVSKSVAILGLGLWLLYLSSLYKTKDGAIALSIWLFPQGIVFFIFGLLQAINTWVIQISIYSQPGKKHNWFNYTILLLGQTFIYVSFYNIILFPISGIGMIEWAIMFLVIFADLVNKISYKEVMTVGQSRMAVFLFGALLYIIKVAIWYVFPANIYNEFFVGNSTMRWIIAIIAGGGIVLLLTQLKVHFFPVKKTTDNNLWDKIISGIGRILKMGIKVIIATFSLPILIVGALSTLLFSLLFVNGIKEDILSVIEPILEQILKTGENIIHISNFYVTFQFLSFIIITVYFVVSHFKLKNYINKKVQENRRLIINLNPNLSKEALNQLKDDSNKKAIFIAVNEKLYNEEFIAAYRSEDDDK